MKRERLLTLIGSVCLILVLAALLLPACAKEEPVIDSYEEYVAGLQEGEFPVPRECFEQAIEEGELYIWEWAEWWPEEIFTGFEEEFGIDITRDYLASIVEVETKFALYPETPYDLVTGMGVAAVYTFKEVGAAGELNPDWIPNVFEYVPEEFIEMDYDPGWKCSVADCMYSYGYVYNTKYVDDPRVPSWAVLFEPMEECWGKITLVDDYLRVIGCALKYLGYNYYSDDEAELMEARDLLLELKPHIMAFDFWPKTLLLGDEAWLSHLGYGDGWFFHDEYEAIMPVLAAEGSQLGIGTTLFPIGSPNPAAAHLFLNYYFRPDVGALLRETIPYPPIHSAVLELLSEEVQRKVTFPEGHVAKCDIFDPRATTGRGLELRLEIWEELKT